MNDRQIRVRGCLLCIGNGTNNEIFINPNQIIGQINHYLYPLQGNGTASTGNKTIFLKEKTLSNLKEFIGEEISYKIDENAVWIAFNALIEKEMEVKILTETPQITLKNHDAETIFVTLQGNVTINHNILKPLSSGRLFKGREANITISTNSVLAVIVFKDS